MEEKVNVKYQLCVKKAMSDNLLTVKISMKTCSSY